MSVSATNADTPVRVQSLSQFVEEVRKMRKAWGIDEHIDLWFRGESNKYPRSVLRPALYRPPSDRVTDMKDVPELLRIEAKLYEEFKRIGLQLINGTVQIEDEEWDWYFLMRHHGAPTRLLDWSDGALVALHFTLKEKTRDAMSRVKPDGQEQQVPRVYVLDPDRLKNALRRATDDYRHEKENWERYVEKHPYFTHGEDSGEAWELAYIPGDTTELQLLPIPSPPLVMDFPHISRRVAA
jgi:FRG domain